MELILLEWHPYLIPVHTRLSSGFVASPFLYTEIPFRLCKYLDNLNHLISNSNIKLKDDVRLTAQSNSFSCLCSGLKEKRYSLGNNQLGQLVATPVPMF
jgi:hypothetical protein